MSEPTEERPGRLSAKELYRRYWAAVVAVITTDKNGDEHVGAAFHVGEGTFVTARHVAEGQVSCRIEVNDYRLRHFVRLGTVPASEEDFDSATVVILPHPDSKKDVGVFSVPKLAPLPTIPLGGHLDDWVDDNEFVLDDVLVLGFPPIPLSRDSVLVAASGQINAVVGLINVDHIHFIISVVPRGGFSGGVALSAGNFALGVVTSSLVKDGAPEELGYLTVLTVEPILECLAAHGLLTRPLAVQWDGLFTEKTWYFGVPTEGWAQAFVEADRDGHRTRLCFACPSNDTVERARDAVFHVTAGVTVQYETAPVELHQFLFEGAYDTLQLPLDRARRAVAEVFVTAGFLPVEHPRLIDRSLARPPFSVT